MGQGPTLWGVLSLPRRWSWPGELGTRVGGGGRSQQEKEWQEPPLKPVAWGQWDAHTGHGLTTALKDTAARRALSSPGFQSLLSICKVLFAC